MGRERGAFPHGGDDLEGTEAFDKSLEVAMITRIQCVLERADVDAVWSYGGEEFLTERLVVVKNSETDC